MRCRELDQQRGELGLTHALYLHACPARCTSSSNVHRGARSFWPYSPTNGIGAASHRTRRFTLSPVRRRSRGKRELDRSASSTIHGTRRVCPLRPRAASPFRASRRSGVARSCPSWCSRHARTCRNRPPRQNKAVDGTMKRATLPRTANTLSVRH